MATVVSTASTLFLELDGRDAGALRSAQPASVRVDMVVNDVGHGLVVRRGVQVTLGEMSAEAALPEPGPLLNWLQALVSYGALPGKPLRASGEALRRSASALAKTQDDAAEVASRLDAYLAR